MVADKSNKKYVSVRKALRELRVNEDQLEKIIATGGIKAYQENNEEVKFDADELEKYRASCVTEGKDEVEKIADESLYESMDGSFDSLFLSQTTKKGNVSAQKSIAEEIPKEPDIVFATANGVNKGKRENVEDYLQKKKAKPVSPVKAISSNKLREKNSLLIQILLLIVIVITSINSYISFQSYKSPNYPKVRSVKVFAEEVIPKLSFSAEVVHDVTAKITAPSHGIIKQSLALNSALKSSDVVFVIENSNISEVDAQKLVVNSNLLELEIINNKLRKVPTKITKELESLSELYKKEQGLDDFQKMKDWLQLLSKGDKFSFDIIGIWLEQKVIENQYNDSLKALEKLKTISILSPFQGKLNNLYVQKDAYVSKGDILAGVVSDKKVFAIELLLHEYEQINFSEPIMIKTEQGEQEGRIVRSIPKNEKIILYVAPKKEASVSIENGVFIVVTLQKRQSLQVASEAIFFVPDARGQNKPSICKVLTKKDETIAFPCPIVLGISDGNYVEVISGVEEGNFIITECSVPLSLLRYGQNIDVVK